MQKLFTFFSENPVQSCKFGRAFQVGFGPKVDKNFGLNSRDELFILGAQKSNQNNLATLLNFLDLYLFSVVFRV